MQTKPIEERIAEIRRICQSLPKVQVSVPRELGGYIELFNAVPELFSLLEELQATLEGTEKMYQGALTLLTAKETGNQALMADRDRYKHLWETDSAQAGEIIEELEGKNKELQNQVLANHKRITALKAGIEELEGKVKIEQGEKRRLHLWQGHFFAAMGDDKDPLEAVKIADAEIEKEKREEAPIPTNPEGANAK